VLVGRQKDFSGIKNASSKEGRGEFPQEKCCGERERKMQRLLLKKHRKSNGCFFFKYKLCGFKLYFNGNVF